MRRFGKHCRYEWIGIVLNALKNLFGKADDREAVRPLYQALIAEARSPHWYQEGAVADTIDGRFDMLNALLALSLLRMESLGDAARLPSTLLAETFVEDMDGQLREIGIGDIVVGKHIGKMMGALGGRLGAYRGAFTAGGDPREALVRNLYRGVTPAPAALDHVTNHLRGFASGLETLALDDLLAGRIDHS